MWNLNFLWPSSKLEVSKEKKSSPVENEMEKKIIKKKETKENISASKSVNQVNIASWGIFTGLEKRKPYDVWNTAIFFPDMDIESNSGPTSELIKYLEAAQVRLEICMFKFSSWRLAKVLLKLVKNDRGDGIEIKIITDADLNNKQLKQVICTLKNKGIEIRLKESRKHMHHKFVIVDEEAVITGSLNWTNVALSKNQEDVIISTDQRHVSKYSERFKVLWKESK